MSGAAVLEARGLRVKRGTREVLHGIDLDVRAGRWLSIVGPNGAGKTTLLKALAHLLAYDGSIRMLGRDAREWPHDVRAQQLAWLGQNEGGGEDLVARDVVMLGRLPHQSWLGVATDTDRAAVEAAMNETQCADWQDRPLGQLSGGERQRVLLARALAVQAPILVMDEPVANLDPPHQADWLRIVRRHVERGGTAISVLHEITMALHADDMVVMDEGRIVHHGPCCEAQTHRAVERVFQQRISVHALAGQWVALPNA